MRGRWTNGELASAVLASVKRRTEVAVDDRERRDIERFEVELGALDDPFSRHAGPRHVTGSGFVVGPRGVLLLRHLRLGVWLQPGGHVDEGETPWEGARREVSEETGLSAAFAASAHWRDGVPDPVHVSVHAVPDGHVHYDVRYLFTAGVAEPAPPPGESQDVRWYEWAAAIAIADPSLRAILHRLWADCGRGAPSGRHDVEPQPEGGGDLDGVEGHVDQRGRQA